MNAIKHLVTIQSTQGIIYRINDNSNISIKLEKSGDGKITQKDKLRWESQFQKNRLLLLL